MRFKDHWRIRQSAAACPTFDLTRIARIGHRTSAKVAAHVEVIKINPFDIGLGLGQAETAGYKALVSEVKLAHNMGVGATA